jgi:hypothetical protein
MIGLGEAWTVGLKSCVDCLQSAKYYSSTPIKTLCPACTATSSKDRQIRVYSIGLTNPVYDEIIIDLLICAENFLRCKFNHLHVQSKCIAMPCPKFLMHHAESLPSNWLLTTDIKYTHIQREWESEGWVLAKLYFVRIFLLLSLFQIFRSLSPTKKNPMFRAHLMNRLC